MSENKGIVGTITTWLVWFGAHLAILNEILQTLSFLGAIVVTFLTIRNLQKSKSRHKSDDDE